MRRAEGRDFREPPPMPFAIQGQPMKDDRPIIFVIDDDSSIRVALEDLLGSAGFEAQSFASTVEFLRSDRPDAPACLVLDVKMPGKSGLDFQRELAESN